MKNTTAILTALALGIIGCQAKQEAPPPDKKVTPVCDMDHLTSKEDRTKLAELRKDEVESEANAQRERATLDQSAMPISGLDPVAPEGVPSLPEYELGRWKNTFRAETNKAGQCVLQYTREYVNVEQPLSLSWAQISSVITHAFAALDHLEDKKARTGRQDSFIVNAWSGEFYSDYFDDFMHSVLANEAQLGALMPWIIRVMPTLVAQLDEGHQAELRLWLEDYHKASSSTKFGRLNEQRIKADQKRSECWNECEGSECDRCPEIFVAQDKNVVRGQVLRRWLKVRGEIKDDATKDDVKAAEIKADQTALLWHYWLARVTMVVPGMEKKGASWVKGLKGKLKKADLLAQRDAYLAYIDEL